MKKYLLTFVVLALASTLYAASPVLYFSDLTSGPSTGIGDGLGSGTIVTVWGVNLGTPVVTAGSPASGYDVYFKDSNDGSGREAAYVYYWCNADGGTSGGGPSNLYDNPSAGAGGSGHKMQEIAFSIPSSDSGAGTIYVTTPDGTSNSLAFTVRAGNIYFTDIEDTGSSNLGTFAEPYLSPSTYYNGAVAGDICYFMGGSYPGTYGNPSGSANFSLTVGSGSGYCVTGTQANPIAYVVYPGEDVTLSAVGAPSWNMRWYEGGPDWYTFSKFDMYAKYQAFGSSGAGVRIIGNNCNAMNYTGAYIGAGGIGLSRDATVYGNTLFGCDSASRMDHGIYPSQCNYERPIYIGWNHIYDFNIGRGPIISVNHEYDRCGAGEYVYPHYIFCNTIDGTLYPSRAVNFFAMSYTAGDPIEPEMYFVNNLIIGCGLYDSDPGASPHDQSAIMATGNTHLYIVHNTLWNTCGGTSAGGGCSGWFSDGSTITLSGVISNNIFHQNSACNVVETAYIKEDNANISTDRNLYYGDGTGPTLDTHAINSDPLIENTASGDYSISASSPAVGASLYDASAIFALLPLGTAFDFLGNTRSGAYTTWDIGAFEYTTGSSPTITGCEQSGGVAR